MLRAERAANAGQGNIEGIGRGFGRRSSGGMKPNFLGLFYLFFHDRLDLVDALSYGTLGVFRRCLQPETVDFGEYTALARHPAVAEGLLAGIIHARRGLPP